MPTNPPPPYKIVYDYPWQDPSSDEYDPLRVIKETPEMKNGRKVYFHPYSKNNMSTKYYNHKIVKFCD